MIDAALADVDRKNAREIQKRIEEYAVECSILKVWGSEMLDMVVDHVVQIHGGYGYVEDYPAERAYRDSRINRIFEGTNEINRLIITGRLLKAALAGQLPLLAAIRKLTDEVLAPASLNAAAVSTVQNVRKLTLFAAGIASQRHPTDLQDQQEILAALADCITELYVVESCTLRAQKLGSRGTMAKVITDYYAATKAVPALEGAVRKIAHAVSEGDPLRTNLAVIRRLSKWEFANTIQLGRTIASHVVAQGKYSL